MAVELKSHGFVLRVFPAREADLVVRIITADGDKISAFAKAGVKSRKRFGGALEPLVHIQFRATKRGEQELYYLEEALVRHDFNNLKSDIDRLAAASYLSELVEQSSQEGLENPEIYNLFGAALKALNALAPVEGVVRQFEVKLLSILGWLPSFQKCSRCGATGGTLTLNAEQGVVTCGDCGESAIPLTLETQGILKELLQTSILKSDWEDRQVRRVEGLTTALLQAHWGRQKLKSLSFWSSLRRFQKH